MARKVSDRDRNVKGKNVGFVKLIVFFTTHCLPQTAFSALTLLVERQERHPARKKCGWWRWALVSPDGVAPSRMDDVSASVNLPVHHKVQKFSSGTGWSRKKGRKTGVCVCYFLNNPVKN